jgi:hypothetical protein
MTLAMTGQVHQHQRQKNYLDRTGLLDNMCINLLFIFLRPELHCKIFYKILGLMNKIFVLIKPCLGYEHSGFLVLP